MVFCGAESGSTDMLQRMNKGGTASAELTIELAARMKSYGIVPEFSFVVGNPPDPEADLAQTLSFIRRIKQVNDATEIILYVYSPVPMDGTFYEAAQDAGFRFPETLEDWVSDRWQAFALRRDPSTPWSHGEVRQKVRDFESVLNAYYPTVTDTRMTPARRRLLRAASAWRYHAKAYAQAARAEPAATGLPISASRDHGVLDDVAMAVCAAAKCGGRRSIRRRPTRCGPPRIRRGRTISSWRSSSGASCRCFPISRG